MELIVEIHLKEQQKLSFCGSNQGLQYPKRTEFEHYEENGVVLGNAGTTDRLMRAHGPWCTSRLIH